MTEQPMRPIPVYDHALLNAPARTAIDATVQSLRALGDVLAWSRQAGSQRRVIEIVTQDEYTHDVVLTDGESYLAFDTT